MPIAIPRRSPFLVVAFIIASAVGGCHGNPGHDPPIHLQQNMDFQERFEPQEANPFFADGRAMRAPVPGTVAVGQLHDNRHLYEGRGLDGRLVDALPPSIPLDRALLDRGRDRYNIFCQPCHGETGYGDGMAMRRGGGFQVVPKSLHDDQLRAVPLGHMYDVVTNGLGTMNPYKQQIVEPRDRWAIAAWVRVLQQSQLATRGDVPDDQLGGKGRQP